MKRRSSRFGFCLNITLLVIVVGLLSSSGSLPQTNLVSAVSAQEKGGVVKPNPTPTPKTRSMPRQSTRKSTSSGTPRKPTAPAKPRQAAPQIELVWIPPGSFEMGSNRGEADEKPVHRVTIKKGFYMGKYEVTQKQWQAIMGNNPSYFKGDNLPVEKVLWDDAQEFIKKLNEISDRYTFRLPTEAEWEYACRAGTTGDYAGDLDEMAWYENNSGKQTHPVGMKKPNGWGLYDMLGNVFEWCQDRLHDNYEGAPNNGSAWESYGSRDLRVKRGCAWKMPIEYCSSTGRGGGVYGEAYKIESYRNNYEGFRVVAVART